MYGLVYCSKKLPAASELLTDKVSAVFNSGVLRLEYNCPLKRASKASVLVSYLTPLEKSTIHPIDSDSELEEGPKPP